MTEQCSSCGGFCGTTCQRESILKYSTQDPNYIFHQPQTNITFQSASKEVLRIERNRIVVAEGVETDEAAKAVLEAMARWMVRRERDIWNEAIDAAAQVARKNWQDGCAELIEELKK